MAENLLSDTFASIGVILDKMKSELKCQICLDLLDNAHATPCHHVFCRECIDQSLLRSDLCPMCKQKVKSRSLREASVTNHVLATYCQLREDAKTLSGTCDAEGEIDVCFTQPLGALPKLPVNNQIRHSEQPKEQLLILAAPLSGSEPDDQDAVLNVADSYALHDAAEAGDLGTLRELLSGTRPAALEKMDRDNTPLQLASSMGHSEACELLLAAKAKLDTAEQGAGRTALHLAALNGFAGCIRVLLDGRADIGLEDQAGQSAIHFACQNEELDAVTLLLQRGVDPDSRDGDGDTPLSLAAWGSRGKGSLPICKLLLHHGANPALKNKFGKGSTAGGLARSKPLKALLNAYMDDVEDKENFVCPRMLIRKRQRSPQRGSAAGSPATRGSSSKCSGSVNTPARSAKSSKSVHEAAVRRSQERSSLQQRYRFIFSTGALGRAARTGEDLRAATAKIASLGGVVDENPVSSSFDATFGPTHLITRCPLKRTEKVIHSCVLGLHILKESFLEESIAAGHFVDERPHRASSDKLWEGAAGHWKQLWEGEQRRPLTGKRVVFLNVKGEKPDQQRLALLERAGAKCAVSDAEDVNMEDGKPADFALFSEEVKGLRLKRVTDLCEKSEIQIVELSYFVDTVCQKPVSL